MTFYLAFAYIEIFKTFWGDQGRSKYILKLLVFLKCYAVGFF